MQISSIHIVFLSCFVHHHTPSLASKYSKETNDVEAKEEKRTKPFRLQKYNDVWNIATEKLSEEQLEKLRITLRKLDKIELELKHMKDSDDPYDGELEASTRRRFLEVLDEHGLSTNELFTHEHHKQHSFDDNRLAKLWAKAVHEAQYTPDELTKMRSEFEHIQDRILEYKELHKVIGEHDDPDNEINNSLDPANMEKLEKRKPEKEMKQLRKDLKDKYHYVKDKLSEHHQQLSDRVHNDKLDTFTDKRVVELWQYAQQSGRFSEQELESIRDELTHFQVRISKNNHWSDHAEKLGVAVNGGEKHLMQEYEEVSKKAKDHARLVKKYHHTMLDRVGHRTEL